MKPAIWSAIGFLREEDRGPADDRFALRALWTVLTTRDAATALLVSTDGR